MSAIEQPGIASSALADPDAFIAQLYVKSRAADFGVSVTEFTAMLNELAGKLAPGVAKPALDNFYGSLRIEDLALARACAAGHERAWEVFMQRFREKLYDVARQITREDSRGRELADSVYADLYGTRCREGERFSKLTLYSGRGSLEGWLRTVLAQEYVNHYRKQRRLVSLDEESEDGMQFAAAHAEPLPSKDPRLDQAVGDALRALSTEDRFVLSSYFIDDRTLAQIAKALGVHESTISRKIEKLAKGVRKQILKNLAQQGMSRRQAEEALEVDVRDLAVNIRESLAQDSAAGAFSNNKGAKG
jgi:RNA polymerase sigma-70 factor (ECF subfamily)